MTGRNPPVRGKCCLYEKLASTNACLRAVKRQPLGARHNDQVNDDSTNSRLDIAPVFLISVKTDCCGQPGGEQHEQRDIF